MKRVFAAVAILAFALNVQAVEQAPKPLQAPPIAGCPANCDCTNCGPDCNCKPQFVSADGIPQSPEQKGPFFPIIPSGTLMQVTQPIPAGVYTIGGSQVTFTT